MTYGWAREFALELIDQATIAGSPVPATYNNQADYLRKIPRLLDDAAVIAATTSHKIRAVAALGSLEHRSGGAPRVLSGDASAADPGGTPGEGTPSLTGTDLRQPGARRSAPIREGMPSPGWEIYTLPANCWQMCSSGLLRTADGRMERCQHYRLVGRDGFAVPRALAEEGGVLVEYWRYPALLGEGPAEDAELDNTVQVQMALPYYAAARLVMLDNSFAYAALYNEFEGKLALGADLPHATLGLVKDTY